MSIALPVSSDADIHDQYANFRGGIQFGKLLEDIDAFAGNIGERRLHVNAGRRDSLILAKMMEAESRASEETSRFALRKLGADLGARPLGSFSALRRRQP
eukprot:3876473-Rhodomonas_salina.3